MSVACGIKEKSSYQWINDISIGFISSILLAMTGLVKVYLPISQVPFTLQNSAVLFMALFLGRKRALYMVSFLILQALVGLPTLASGIVGPALIIGPTAGYLVGYLLSAYFIGGAMEGKNGSFRAISYLVIGTLLQYSFGALWLGSFIGIEKAIIYGALIYMPLDLFKVVFFGVLYQKIKA